MKTVPQKILFVAESLNVGGAEKALTTILSLMDYDRYDVTLLLISMSGAFVADITKISDLKVRAFTKPGKSLWGRLYNAVKIKALYRWCPARIIGNRICNGYDTVIAFTEGYLTKWIGASGVSCKKIAWVHTDMVNNDWPLKTGVYNSVDEECNAYQQFNNIVAVSKNVANGIIEKFSCNNVSVVYNIIDLKISEKSKAKVALPLRRKLNLIGVGRLEEVKGFDNLIKAIGFLVNKKKYDIGLTLLGDGSQRFVLETLVKDENLADSVRLTGMVKNPYPYIKAADVFVCPSRREGFNIAILEAMTIGVPIIATNSAGPAEILENGKYGMLVDNNVQGIVDGISHLYEDKDCLDRLKSLSFERSKDFSAKNQLEFIYKLVNS